MAHRRSAAFVLCWTAVLYGLFRAVGWFDIQFLERPWTEGLLKVAVWAVPSLLLVSSASARPLSSAASELGLSHRFAAGFGAALVASLPMLVGPSRGFVPHITLSSLAGVVCLTPITEEILFRGFLFRQLYRRGGLAVARAMVLSALAFALAHFTIGDYYSLLAGPLSRSAELGAVIGMPVAGQIGSTVLVGLVLAWMAYRWDSLWPSIGVHMFLNLSWELYGRGLDGRSSLTLMLRVASIALAILLTLRFTRPRRSPSGSPEPAVSGALSSI
jgi:membrane protease YdiL (CAAX protease family)